MFRWLRTMMMELSLRWHAAARRHYLVDHDEIEAIRQRTLDVETPNEERRKELEWLRTYQRELDYRMKAAQLDSQVIARLRARVAGHE